MLERASEVRIHLRAAEEQLRAAAVAATETDPEDETRTGLQGELAMLLGGLSQSAGSLADLLERVAV